MFVNNARFLPFRMGFDQQAHAEYIKYIQQHHSLPLPNQGSEMFQPPLFYSVCAVLLSLFHSSIDQPFGVLLVRLLTTAFGIANFVLVWLSLRLLFPNNLSRQLAGTLFAAFLPMQLYLAHFTTNESLAATLSSASIYVALLLFKGPNRSIALFALLGLLLGLAILTKATALLLVPAMLLGSLLFRGLPFRIFARNALLTGACCFAVCGWHYIPIWHHFGKLFVGNWEPASGFAWWQDPGYHTAVDYLRFGRTLSRPLFSGVAGFGDGIYSTFWGDALIGGAATLDTRPPWNDSLIAAGYLLALVPSAILLVGGIVAMTRFLRRPSASWVLLLSFASAIFLGLVFMTLRVPSYAQIKAFYASSMLVPLSCLVAVGWDWLTGGRRLIQLSLGIVLLLCAINSFASYWIRPTTYQSIYAGLKWSIAQNNQAASMAASSAAQAADQNARTRRLLSLLFNMLGQPAAAREQAERAVALNDADGAAHMQLALALAGENRVGPAIEQGRRAIALYPDVAEFYAPVVNWLLQTGAIEESYELAQQGLAVNPYKAELHYLLGGAAMEKADYVAVANQFGYASLLRKNWSQVEDELRRSLAAIVKKSDARERIAELLRNVPDSPRELDALAWLLATYPDDRIRNSEQALLWRRMPAT